jgi:hypothetical protein
LIVLGKVKCQCPLNFTGQLCEYNMAAVRIGDVAGILYVYIANYLNDSGSLQMSDLLSMITDFKDKIDNLQAELMKQKLSILFLT